MKNPNWNKQAILDAARRSPGHRVEDQRPARAVTEDELDAYRFRGTPIRRRVARSVRPPSLLPEPGTGRGV